LFQLADHPIYVRVDNPEVSVSSKRRSQETE
jgi:hypothetical protein